ncbi:hypothetical protein ACWC2T_06790 [Streptomyces sp. NPDC001393]
MICRASAAAAMAATTLALLAGCSLPDGPPGVVVDRADRWSSATKSRQYFLTVRTADGSRKEFQVSFGDYDRCPPGPSYPNCAKR